MDVESLRMTNEDVHALWQGGHGVERVVLTDYERAEILPYAQQAMIGGWSDIHLDRAVRGSELGENNLVGFACEAAFFKWSEQLGSGGINAWKAQRSLRNANKWAGDGGVDCVLADGTRVDVKGSECRGVLTVQGALNYHLTQCRTKTLEDVAYVQCHTKRHMDSYQVPKVVLLAGWLWGRELSGREDMPSMRGWSARCSTIRKMKELRNGW
jgi:hypothetical protein